MLMRYFEGVKKMKGVKKIKSAKKFEQPPSFLSRNFLFFLISKFILNILPHGTYSQSKY